MKDNAKRGTVMDHDANRGLSTSNFEYDIMKYKLANDALGIALWDMDVAVADPVSPENKLIWSQELRHMLGFSDESDFPNTIFALADRFHPEDSAKVFAAFAAHFNDRTGQTPYHIEYRLKHKNGEYRHFMGFGGTLRDKNGVPLRVSGAVMDITETKQMEARLERQQKDMAEAHNRAKVIMEASPIGTTLWDRDCRLFDCNEAYVRLFDLKDIHEFLEHHLLLNPEYQPDGWRSSDKIAAMVQRAFAQGKCDFEWMHRAFDGTPIPCFVNMVVVAYEGDYAVAGYLHDLREQKAMMSALERRDTLMSVSNQVAGTLLQSDIDDFDERLMLCMGMIGKAVDANRASVWINSDKDGRLHCTQIYEWLEGAESQMSKDITIEAPYDEVIPGWEKILSSGKSINSLVRDLSSAEQKQLTAQGIKSLSVMPIFVREIFWGFMGLDHCNEERILDETELDILRSCGLMIANALLRNVIIHDLRDASAQAMVASQAKSNFLSNMSHEMRTPLNAIIGMTAIAKKTEDPERKNHAINKIGDASSHLLGVINDVLDMAKIEADKLELAPIEYHFERMLQSVLSVINFRVDEKQQTLTINVDSRIPHFLFGDDQRLAQVISNLLSNAVKFTPAGGRILLEATLAGEADGCHELCIKISDSGIGISAEQKERLFSAFEQAEKGTSRQYGGTGLGLVISKRIVELMGGDIWVESEPGKGAQFIFTAKVIACPDEGTDNAEGDAADSIASAADFRGKRLLVAEDIEINREILMALLEDVGLIIDCADNGEEALTMIESEPSKYDIVFMDVQMPVMDGLEATRRIRALPASADIRLPIIAMTANVFKSDIEECLAAGMDDHLGKPLDIDKVLAMLRKYLSCAS